METSLADIFKSLSQFTFTT